MKKLFLVPTISCAIIFLLTGCAKEPPASYQIKKSEEMMPRTARVDFNSNDSDAAPAVTETNNEIQPPAPLPRRRRAEIYRERHSFSNEGQPFGLHWRNAKPADFIYIVPTNLGIGVFSAVGNAVCWPFSTVYEVANGNHTMYALVPPLEFAEKYFGIPGGYVIGAPFWCIKKAFVDFPVWVFSGDDEPEQ